MKHIVNFSGGVCSFWAAKRVVDTHGTGDVVLLFADTKMEDPDLYRFNQDAERVLGVKLTVIADGRTPWEVFRDVKFLGNSRVDPCSRVLKRDLLDKWIADRYEPGQVVRYVGIDWTESHRLDNMRLRMPKWRVEAPMCNEPYWGKDRMMMELTKLGIAPPHLYSLGFPHNNCGGFCIKAGQAHFAHLLKTLPDRYAFHEEQERAIRKDLGDVSILKDRRGGGPRRPMSLEEFRSRVETGDYDQHEWGGCGCAVDHPQEEFDFGTTPAL